MSTADKIDRLRNYPMQADRQFREQLERAVRENLSSPDAPVIGDNRGIDRSRELTPVNRPALVRSIQGFGPAT